MNTGLELTPAGGAVVGAYELVFLQDGEADAEDLLRLLQAVGLLIGGDELLLHVVGGERHAFGHAARLAETLTAAAVKGRARQRGVRGSVRAGVKSPVRDLAHAFDEF